MSHRVCFLWVYEGLLLLGLIEAVAMCAHGEFPLWTLIPGVGLNALFQWSVIHTIRFRMRFQRMSDLERAPIAERIRVARRTGWTMFATIFGLIAIVGALVEKHVISMQNAARVFAVLTIFVFVFFTLKLRRFQQQGR